MIFTKYYSSSKSNLYAVTARNGDRLLIECGTTWNSLNKALRYDFRNIMGCLLTHEHKDHSKAIRDVMTAGINVYSSQGTFDACDVVPHRRARVIERNTMTKIGPFVVGAFRSNHPDAVDPLLYIVSCDGERLLFATDTCLIKQGFNHIEFNIIAIECSYDIKILRKREKEKTIHTYVAKRLLESHMEVRTTKKYLTENCNLEKCRQICLLHMSGSNIDRAAVKQDFERRFFIETKV